MVAKVFFPGKHDNCIQKEILEQNSFNSGSVLSILLKCGSVKKFVSSLKLFNHNESVGSVDSSVLMAGKLY